MSSVLSMLRRRILVVCSCVLLVMSSFSVISATLEEGAILVRWKNMMGDSSKLTNWQNASDPCASNPWFHVMCDSRGFVTRVDLGSTDLSGPIAAELGQLSRLETLTLYNNSFSGIIPPELGNLSTLVFLDLSANKLNGTIPASFGNLLSATFIKLSFNNLSGSIPVQLTKPPMLTDFQVANNNLSGRVYTNASWSNQGRGAFVGNLPSLCGVPVGKSCPGDPPLPDSSSSRTLSTKIIIIIVVSMAFGVFSVSIIYATIVRKLLKKIMALRAIEEEFARKEVKPNLYSYNELKSATQNFSQHNVLGKGGFGTVYKGVLPNGTMVAVKHLSKSKQVLHEFLNEIVLITGIRHRNLVKLKGCCLREDQRILVYEYIDNGDLADALWKNTSKPGAHKGLDWLARLNIILEIAQGLTYLHEHVQPPIIHRDIKAPNILLDGEFRAKIADFGLALLFPPLEDGQTHLSAVEIAGTRGYMAPEYASFGQVTVKVDVFSFGVLMLEIVSGRKNVDVEKPLGQQYLLEWVWELHALEKLHDMVDKQLTTNKQGIDEITRVARIGLLCVQYVAARRPRMSDVVAMLQGRIPLPDISNNYELDVYRGHEAKMSTTNASELKFEFDNVIVECEEESSLLNNSHEALDWQANRVAMELTPKYPVKRREYHDNCTQTEPLEGYLT